MDQYAIEARISYYDRDKAARWKEAPHVHLANVRLNEEAAKAFSERYGLLYRDVRIKTTGTEYQINLRDVRRMQALLQRAWSGEADALHEIENGNSDHVDDWTYRPVAVEWSIARKRQLEIVALDLWSFVRLLFLRDYSAKRTLVCANPNCPTPYFVQNRKDQIFCSHGCAVAVNVRRFRDRVRKEGE